VRLSTSVKHSELTVQDQMVRSNLTKSRRFRIPSLKIRDVEF
jgi:hypothetical protein